MDTRFTRPWTPPSEADAGRDDGDDARSDYFSDPFRPSSVSSRVSLRSRRYDSSTESSRAKTKEPAPFTPFTPKRAFSDHAPRYPFTPDSSQVLRARSSTPHTPSSSLFTPDSSLLLRTRSSTPLSPIPWHEDTDGGADLSFAASPVQNALSACISQFEHLIQTRRPTHDQMEYIVGQFEAMASRLSGQSANDADKSPCPSPSAKNASSAALDEASLSLHNGLDAPAPRVPKEDLQQRMDEVKTLNEIQLDVIDDLRQQMKFIQQGVQTSLDGPNEEEDTDTVQGEDEEQEHSTHPNQHDSASWEDTNNEERPPVAATTTREFSTQTSPTPSPRARKVVIIRKNQPSFWASFGDALDAFGSSLFDN